MTLYRYALHLLRQHKRDPYAPIPPGYWFRFGDALYIVTVRGVEAESVVYERL